VPNDCIADLKIHAAAQLFPEMDEAALNRLYESVKVNGVKKPILLLDGQLVDGRNRVRAALLCGIPWTQLPKVKLPPEADPYQWAWMMNCERLDYPKEEKAKIHLRIMEESAKLDATRSEVAEAANLKRSGAAKAKPRREDGTIAPSLPPSGGTVDAPKPDPRKHNTAAKLAEQAGVSQRTMERAMGRVSNGGSRRARLPKKQASPSLWRVPRNVAKLAGFLIQNMPSEEVKKLAALLMEAYQAAKATA
jgi:hypothetical protein